MDGIVINSQFQTVKENVSIFDALKACNLPVTSNGFIRCPSPNHNDKNPTNCKVYADTNRVYCHACGYSADIFDVWQSVKSCTHIDAVNALRNLSKHTVNNPSIKPIRKKESLSKATETNRAEAHKELSKMAKITHQNLLKDEGVLEVVKGYGYTIETIKRHKLGLCNHHKHLTIPIKIDSFYHDIRRYQPDSKIKYRPWKIGTGKNVFWGMDKIRPNTGQKIALVSGVSDRLISEQNGLTAVCPTTGESSINLNQFKKTGLAQRLEGNTVFYFPDNDDAGRRSVKPAIESVTSCNGTCVVVDLSENGTIPENQRKDLKDFFLNCPSQKNFLNLISFSRVFYPSCNQS